MHPRILLQIARHTDAELAHAAERSRRLRESRRVHVRRPAGRGDPAEV
jgi:hypothetical protein